MRPTLQAAYSSGFETAKEHSGPTNLRVEGALPAWLEGSLLRTAPAQFEVGESRYRHWFDGHAMLHRFAIANGEVKYSNRFLESKARAAALAEGKISYPEFGTDPCHSLFQRIIATFQPSKTMDNCNVNVVRSGDAIVAMTETPMRITFDAGSLHIKAEVDAASHIKGQITTAHPHYDRDRKTSYNYLLHLGRKSTYKIVATDEKGQDSLLASIEVDNPSYVHSFGMSENYLVLALPSLVVNTLRLMFSGKAFIYNYRWKPELGLRFFVIDKRDGRLVCETRANARFMFHHVNAFEDAGALVVDLLAYPDAAIINRLELDNLRSAKPTPLAAELRRYRIALASGAVTDARLSSTGIELPRINYAQVGGHPYRWVYGTGARDGDFSDCIVKIDVNTGDAAQWYVHGLYPGEPVFVPEPDGINEDKGVLLSVVLDPENRNSFLLVLNAADLSEIARAHTPDVISFGFHGNFFRG